MRQQQSYQKQPKSRVSTFFVTLGAIVLTTIITTFFVSATDTSFGFGDSLGSSAVRSVLNEETSLCPSGMKFVSTSERGFCIDEFENSPSKNCLYDNPQSTDETLLNLEKESCLAESKEDASPWTNIKQHEAERLCRAAGKRLPSNQEWYLASIGTPDTKKSLERKLCNVASDSGVANTGTFAECASDAGVRDQIGNVWEWTNEMVINGSYKEREVPDEGYVKGVDGSGVAILTDPNSSDQSFSEDYVWTKKDGVYGMLRGGYFQSGSDAGTYSINMSVPPMFSGSAVGFRCVL